MLPWAHPSPHPKQHLEWFGCFCTAHGREFLYFTMGHAFPFNITPLYGGPEPPWFLGPTQVHNPNGISTDSAVFAGLTTVTDQQTDRQSNRSTPSVTQGCTYVHSTVMQFNKDYCCCRDEAGGHSQSQLHTPGTHYHLTLDLVTLYTPLKTTQNTPVQTVLT